MQLRVNLTYYTYQIIFAFYYENERGLIVKYCTWQNVVSNWSGFWYHCKIWTRGNGGMPH